jgi:hypothetical protein
MYALFTGNRTVQEGNPVCTTMAESYDITDAFEGYVTAYNPEPWLGIYPDVLDGLSGDFQILSDVMYVQQVLGANCRIRTWASHINSGVFSLPDEINIMFDQFNMEYAYSIEDPGESSGAVIAISISDPEGAVDFTANEMESACREIEIPDEFFQGKVVLVRVA